MSASNDDLDHRIRQVSTEIRMVLPGAQALLGFQFITFVLAEFDKLPPMLKDIHVVSSMLLTLSVILLMTPAAYHRIVEDGENTEHFQHFAIMLLSALIPLALGIAGDFYVVTEHVIHAEAVSIPITTILLAFFFGLWFGVPLLRRHRDGAVKTKARSAQS